MVGLFPSSQLVFAQDASFQSDESYVTADELPAISGVGQYDPIGDRASGPRWHVTPSWEMLQNAPTPGCFILSDKLVMPVAGEIRADITLAYPSAELLSGIDPGLFTLKIVGRDAASGNEVIVASHYLTPRGHGFQYVKHSRGTTVSLASNLSVSLSGNNSSPLLDVHLRACDFFYYGYDFVVKSFSVHRAAVYLRRKL